MIKDMMIESKIVYIESDFKILKVETLDYRLYIAYTTNGAKKILKKFHTLSVNYPEPEDATYIGHDKDNFIFVGDAGQSFTLLLFWRSH